MSNLQSALSQNLSTPLPLHTHLHTTQDNPQSLIAQLTIRIVVKKLAQYYCGRGVVSPIAKQTQPQTHRGT